MTIKAGYYQLGIELGLRPGELQAIQQTCSQNVAQALTQVLLTWLRQLYNVEKYGPPTWRRLVEAVDSPAGGNNHALAKQITERHPMSSMKVNFGMLSLSLSLSLSVMMHTEIVCRCYGFSQLFSQPPSSPSISATSHTAPQHTTTACGFRLG